MKLAETAAWGAVGALSFLVLALPYRALVDDGPGIPVLLALASVVGVGAAALVRAAAPRLRAGERN